MKGELYLYNYAAKPGVKKQQLRIHKKSELTTLKLEVGELDTDKLKTDPTDLSRLSNVADKAVVQKLCLINQSLRSMPLILVDLF